MTSKTSNWKASMMSFAARLDDLIHTFYSSAAKKLQLSEAHHHVVAAPLDQYCEQDVNHATADTLTVPPKPARKTGIQLLTDHDLLTASSLFGSI